MTKPPTNDPASAKDRSDVSSESESSDDEDLGLEGVLVRHPDASSSSDDDDDDDDNNNNNNVAPDPLAPGTSPSTMKRSAPTQASAGRRASKQSRTAPRRHDEPELVQVTFTFCDMADQYYHALRSLLHASGTVYQPQASALTEHMIDNVSVGTLVSTQDDDEGNVYGFASVLNVTTYQASPAIQHLKQHCLEHCPKDRKEELQVVLGGNTKRPAGILLLGRMVNLPLEITLELYQQLVKDMDWAVEHAEGGEEERKSLDFGVFLRLAPCQEEGSSVVYSFFEDEIFAGRAEFVFTADAPKAYSKEEKQMLRIMALTKQGFRDGVADIARMVGQT